MRLFIKKKINFIYSFIQSSSLAKGFAHGPLWDREQNPWLAKMSYSMHMVSFVVVVVVIKTKTKSNLKALVVQ